MSKKEELLWNPTTNERQTFWEIEKEFGTEIAQGCLHCYESGEKYSKKLIRDMHRVKNGLSEIENTDQKQTEPQPDNIKSTVLNEQERTQHKNNNGNRFLRLWYEIMESEKYRHNQASKATLLLELMRRAVKSPKQSDPYDLYNIYYKEQDSIAVVAKQDELADWFRVHRGTISRWLRQLEKEESIKTVRHPKHKNVNVYIVGLKKYDKKSKKNKHVYLCC